MNHIERFRELTAREREVLDLFCQGLPYREIGERLFISVKGVKSHMQHIYQKLGLMHLPPKARAFALREDYWPLVKSEPTPVQDETAEPEIIEPIPAEVEALIDADEASMKALVVAEPIQIVTPPKPPKPHPRRRFSCFSFILILLVAGATAFWYFDGLALVQGVLANALPTPTQEVASNPALGSSSGQSPTQTPTSVPTKASTATGIPTQTTAPTPRSSPTPNYGPVYELGEWHKEGNLWFRLADYSVDWEGIYITVEMWNQTGQPVYFQWSTNRSMMLRDNRGNRYTVDSRFDGNVDNEIVPANTRTVIGSDPYINWTNWYDPDNLFLPGVTDLYLTLEDFSSVGRATWQIRIGN